MKKLFVVLVMVYFAFGFDPEAVKNNTLSGGDDDKLIAITFNTTWRVGINYSDYKGVPYRDTSNVTIVINITKGVGYLLDETPSIFSMYSLTNVNLKNCEISKGVDKLMITFDMESNVGNFYHGIVNDAYGQMIFVGPNLDAVVIREL